MFRLPFCLVHACSISFLVMFFSSALVVAQVETATVSGQVVDSSGLTVAGARIDLVDIERGTSTRVITDNSGLYRFPSVHPGRYRMQVRSTGFRVIDVTGLTINVQDHLEQNFKLALGSVSESVTVDGGASLVDTETGTVSTVVDRNFAENLPMNGRSFQSLVELTPGVALTATNSQDSGQFSINGQRAASNYWTVDGVSANTGISSNFNVGNGLGGAAGPFSVLGGTNSLVSVDAMEEFRIQTSTYAPEFGRTPGGQISILTRSGTNRFHGTAFNYLRNDALDASDWFNGYRNNPPLPKAEERQNDFGGTIDGPILLNRTFFFFSYEGLRLRLPHTTLTTVPDIGARQSAVSSIQPFLNSFPIPNGSELGNGSATFDASYSDPATLDSYSIRVDHRMKPNVSIFGRYSYSPSQIAQRGNGSALSTVSVQRITSQTATVGSIWTPTHTIGNDLRFNYSRTNAQGNSYLDSFGGATPLSSSPFPSPYDNEDAQLQFGIISGTDTDLVVGRNIQQVQHQLNLVDSLSFQKGTHSLKAGVDYRRLSPSVEPARYGQVADFLDVPSAQIGSVLFAETISNRDIDFVFRNLGVFVQDTWRVRPHLTLTYGLRWDVDYAPATINEPNVPAVVGFNPRDLSKLALASPSQPPFRTPYRNLAPRVGLAYQVLESQDWGTTLRGGFGVFYDLVTSGTGNLFGFSSYPFSGSALFFGGTFPFAPAEAVSPPISPAAGIVAFDPHMSLPYALEWNTAIEQGLGKQQTASATYVGSIGRSLLQSTSVFSPNPRFQRAELIANTATSDYNALQLQFQRRLVHGLQALASYTWSHSIDDASAGSVQDGSNAFVPAAANRGPSSFDIRNAASVGLTYDFPRVSRNNVLNGVVRGWSLENFIIARSAPPVDVSSQGVEIAGFSANARPDQIPGIPVYLFGLQYPGGKEVNSSPGVVPGGCANGSPSVGPFCPPPVDPSTGFPLRQGNLGRNALRGFGATQWDLAIHRKFTIREPLTIQFRAELFNLLNHPNFGQPNGNLFDNNFGQSTQTLGQYLSGGNIGGGGLSPLYQVGGPRSIQVAIKIAF